MTLAMWKELEEGAPQEFAVNEALMVEGDPRPFTGKSTGLGAREL